MAAARRLGQNVSASHVEAAIPARVRCLRFYPSPCNQPTTKFATPTTHCHDVILPSLPLTLKIDRVDDHVPLVNVLCEAPNGVVDATKGCNGDTGLACRPCDSRSRAEFK